MLLPSASVSKMATCLFFVFVLFCFLLIGLLSDLQIKALACAGADRTHSLLGPSGPLLTHSLYCLVHISSWHSAVGSLVSVLALSPAWTPCGSAQMTLVREVCGQGALVCTLLHPIPTPTQECFSKYNVKPQSGRFSLCTKEGPHWPPLSALISSSA